MSTISSLLLYVHLLVVVIYTAIRPIKSNNLASMEYYVIDKIDFTFNKYCNNDNSNYHNNVCCIITDHINGYYYEYKYYVCNIIILNTYKRDICYYVIDFFKRDINNAAEMILKDLSNSLPSFGNKRVDINNPISYLAFLENNRMKTVIRKPETKEMEFIWTKCINFASEICRIHQDFSDGIAYFYRTKNTNIRALFKVKVSMDNEINYPITSEGIGFKLPTVRFINDWISKMIFDKIYNYHKNMITKVDHDIRMRDCLLINEIDKFFMGLHSYPEPIYQLIIDIRLHIMSAFNNMASLMSKKAEEKWLEIQKASINDLSDVIMEWYDLFDWFKKDLFTPMKSLFDDQSTLAFISEMAEYFHQSSQLNKYYGPVTTKEYEIALERWDNAHQKLAILFTSQLSTPSKYGIAATRMFFTINLSKYDL